MGEGKHSRFSLRSGSHRAVGVAFGRSSLGVEEGDPIDAAVRLEVNRWKGSVEPRVVLRELYPLRPAGAEPGRASPPSGGAGSRRSFSATLGEWRAAARSSAGARAGPGRVETVNSGAAMVAELASSGGGEILAAVADTERRAPLARDGVRLVDAFSTRSRARARARIRARRPRRPAGLRAGRRPARAPERRAVATSTSPGGRPSAGSASRVLDQHLARRPALIAVFRALREAGDCSGEQLREALGGRGTEPRRPEAAARCFRVLTELGLVQGTPDGATDRGGRILS